MKRRDASRPHPWRRRLVLTAWLTAAGLVVGRAAQIQVVEGSEWSSIAETQHRTNVDVAAPRGAILARDGTPLAVSRETFRVGVAGRELVDPGAVARLLEATLDISAADAARITSAKQRWSMVAGSYPPSVREALRHVRGVYLQRELQRYHPHGELARGVLGAVVDGSGQGGVEQEFDPALRGREGSEVVARDNEGRPVPGETFLAEPPVSGGEIVLTIDVDLQEIAREALAETIAETEAAGGDVLVTDPRTGEILALVSMRGGATAALSAINAPYEPGSTLKPFTVAGLLREGVASLDDTVDVEDGTWTVEGRTLHDVHHSGRLSIADALRISSNVGIAKAAQVLGHGQQYEVLRDFGFGAPTGLPLPGESGGTLRRPDRWSAQSAASLAIGYEIGVTPLQMAMAFGALANDGVLMEPRLVREIRDAQGRTVERFEPRPVRRAVPPGVARAVSEVLVDVVEDGTGTSARLGTFRVAGKSGTSRAYTASGGYEGGYNSSFVGFFPAEDPQLLVFVKLDRPRGDYYGGAVAAPVTRATMEAALAARATTLDRGALLRSLRDVAPPAEETTRFVARLMDPPPASAEVPVEPAAASGTRPIPDVAGLPARVAVRRLHAAGLRVEMSGSGDATGTVPRAGTRVEAGDTVELRTRAKRDG